MKSLPILFIAAFLSFSLNLSAAAGSAGTEDAACIWKSWFKYPKNNGSYEEGKSIYVKVDPQKYQDIAYMELSINGKFIRKESRYPYEWCKGEGSSDRLLRNLKKGTYRLKCKIKDNCGKFHEIYCTFYVKGRKGQVGKRGGGNAHGGNGRCKYRSWFKYPKNNGTYRYGSDVYVRVDTEKYQDIKEMHLYVNNSFVRKESRYPYEWCKGQGNNDRPLRNLKRGTYNLKCRVKTNCGKWHEYFCKFYVR